MVQARWEWQKDAGPESRRRRYRALVDAVGLPYRRDGLRASATNDGHRTSRRRGSQPFLPFQQSNFDAVDLVEVVEHTENQPQLIREIARVLRPGGRVLISTPNILNVVSRLRFLFTGFLRGRVQAAHYTSKPGQAPNIYLLHFYELYYLLFHYGFEIEKLRWTRVRFAARFFTYLFWPLIIGAEKDPVQRRYNWQILAYLFDPALLMSDNIVVIARKRAAGEDRPGS